MSRTSINQTIENALWDYVTKLAGCNPSVKDARRYLLAALEAEGLVVVDRKLIQSAADSICGAYCPSTWDSDEQPHCDLCSVLHADAKEKSHDDG